jgi:hypothetical protein
VALGTYGFLERDGALSKAAGEKVQKERDCAIQESAAKLAASEAKEEALRKVVQTEELRLDKVHSKVEEKFRTK